MAGTEAKRSTPFHRVACLLALVGCASNKTPSRTLDGGADAATSDGSAGDAATRDATSSDATSSDATTNDAAKSDAGPSTLIAPSRVIDWSIAGLPAMLPSGEAIANPWTPPTRTTLCATIQPEGTAANPVAPTDIAAAIAACPTGQTVFLAPGSFYFNASLTIASNNNSANAITLRGSGADKTKIYFAGSSGIALSIPYAGSANWTDNFARGATTITLDSVGGMVKGQTILGLTECGTGFSGPNCTNATDSQVDNGSEWICAGDGPWCSHGGTGNEGGRAQTQVVLVTDWSGAGPYQVTISPGLYLDNWSASNSPMATVFNRPIYGIGLEDLSIDETASSSQGVVEVEGCYGCWAKGLRVVGKLQVDGSKNVLIANNYVVEPLPYTVHDGYGITLTTTYGESDVLVINNITHINAAIAMDGAGEGNVFAYNTQEGCSNASANNPLYDMDIHTGGTAYLLAEANQHFAWLDDNIHGTHDLTTLFRNRFSAQLEGYNAGSVAVLLGNGTRFTNILGNVLGTTGFNQSYETAPDVSGAVPIYSFGFGAALGVADGPPRDVTVRESTLRWMNYDTVNGAVRQETSEVPSGLMAAVGHQETLGTGDGSTNTFSGTLAHACFNGSNDMVYDRKDAIYAYDNGTGMLIGPSVESGSITCPSGAVTVTFTVAPASGSPIYVNYLEPTSTPSPYQTPVPPTSLPASVFLPVTAHPNGGTGLSWWKVCEDYPTCSMTSTPPFPPIGPDVTGGTGPGGHSYDLPAHIAFEHLPVDTSYQQSYSVTSIACSSGTVTATLSTALPYVPNAEFTISGVSPSGFNGTFNITDSTTTTVKYQLASCPAATGSGSGGALLYPNLRRFNEAIYQVDSP